MAAKDQQRALVRALIDLRGRTFCDELKIRIAQNAPAPLFQLLCASLLFSARIASKNAAEAMRALLDAGLSTPRKMAAASWQERVDVITWHGYKRYDERTSTMLGETAEQVLDWYGGDLRWLREEAEHEVGGERELLQEFTGVGGVGADIFLREVQGVWDEVHPYADRKVLESARELGLPDSPAELAKLTSRKQFPALVAALVRTKLGKDYDEVREAAHA